MFNVGDFVFDKESGASAQVLERIEMWGYTSYKLLDPSSNRVYKASEDQLSANDDLVQYDENYLRYVALLSKIKNETAGGYLSSLSSGLIPLPHQIHVLNKVMENNRIRYILADEVGLGKTIEAGMVIKELKARGLVRRVLVVCPTGLVTQWAAEMQDKFDERFQIILPSDFDTIRRLTDSEDVYGQYDQIISPMDAIKPLERRAGWTEERVEQYNEERIYSIINSGWDLIIIDEAHKVAGSSGEVARYKLGALLSQASPYLLLLSATPHNGKTEPFLRLVRLLDNAVFPNAKSVVKEQVAPYLIRTEKREAIDSNGNRLFKNRITHLVSLNWNERHTMQRELYQMVSAYVSKNYDKALKNRKKNMCYIFLMIIMQRMATSSTAAVRQSLERRLDVLSSQSMQAVSMTETDLADLDVENGSDAALESVSLNLKEEIADIEQMIATAKQAGFQNPDVKVEKLEETLGSLFTNRPDQKVIIFTEFVATQVYLKDILEKQGYQVSVLNGSMGIEERNMVLREFRETTSIFISTDAGGEGLNLQFSNVIINYDLPWNPMKIEQRCGRVDRIGQKEDVHIYNFVIEDTVENRVREVLEEKLSVILEEMGVDKYSDVLDSDVAEMDFTDVYMKSIRKPYKLDENLYSVESEMKQQLENTRKYKEILKEEKDLSALTGDGPSFDIDEALGRLVFYYNGSREVSTTAIPQYRPGDPELREYLKPEILQSDYSKLMHVGIKDFPNEEGYFMLWDLSVSDDRADRKILPIFINKDFILRPMAGARLNDVFLDPHSKLTVLLGEGVSEDDYLRLKQMSTDFAYDTFAVLRNKRIQRTEESYNKYMYALQLRKESIEKIGIENIRSSRLQKLQTEKEEIEKEMKSGSQIYPDFRLILLAKLEA